MKKSHQEKSELEKSLEAELAEESSADAADAESSESQEDPRQAELEQLQREKSAFADQLLRHRAEFDNYRKRMMRESDRVRQQAAEALIRDLLPVVDHLELAMKHRGGSQEVLAEGVAMVLRQFHDVLNRHGVEPIVAAGETFNPEVHDAVMQRESDDVPAQSVIEEFQKGYRLGQLVLRPAKVVVSLGTSGRDDTIVDETGSVEVDAQNEALDNET